MTQLKNPRDESDRRDTEHSMNPLKFCNKCDPHPADAAGCSLPGKLHDNQLSLAEFWDALSHWSQATFGSDEERGPVGPLKHLQKELDEVDDNMGDITEHADMIFLIFDAARRAGLSLDPLVKHATDPGNVVIVIESILKAILAIVPVVQQAPREVRNDVLYRQFAHVLLLVQMMTRLAGFNDEEVRIALNEKLKVNQARTWPTPVDDEPVEHVRDAEST